MAEFFAMGGYAAYIWSAYGAAVLILVALVVDTWARHQRSRRGLAALERLRGRRKRA